MQLRRQLINVFMEQASNPALQKGELSPRQKVKPTTRVISDRYPTLEETSQALPVGQCLLSSESPAKTTFSGEGIPKYGRSWMRGLGTVSNIPSEELHQQWENCMPHPWGAQDELHRLKQSKASFH